MSRTLYEINVQDRSSLRFFIGLIPRFRQFIKHERARRIARRRGATVGESTVLPLSLAKRANKNLVIGDHTYIQTDKIDLRCPVVIGNYVMIGNNTEIITTSHNIDSPDWEHKYYGINIQDYVWIATKALVLPSCRKIGRGAVIAGGGVVVRDVNEMSIVSGNPATEIRKRKYVHSNLVVESMLGGDFKEYIRIRKKQERVNVVI